MSKAVPAAMCLDIGSEPIEGRYMREHAILHAEQERGNVTVPGEQTLSSWLISRIARYDIRPPDWDALKFQADYDPKYRRAQMRYVGTGGTGVAKDMNTVPAGGFTFSTMVIPAGNIGPSHIHTDVEEIFFVLRGKMKVICERDGETWEAVLGERDLISVPPGVYRTEINIGEEDALMCVMLGSPKPITPTYPPDSPLAKIKRDLAK